MQTNVHWPTEVSLHQDHRRRHAGDSAAGRSQGSDYTGRAGAGADAAY